MAEVAGVYLLLLVIGVFFVVIACFGKKRDNAYALQYQNIPFWRNLNYVNSMRHRPRESKYLLQRLVWQFRHQHTWFSLPLHHTGDYMGFVKRSALLFAGIGVNMGVYVIALAFLPISTSASYILGLIVGYITTNSLFTFFFKRVPPSKMRLRKSDRLSGRNADDWLLYNSFVNMIIGDDFEINDDSKEVGVSTAKDDMLLRRKITPRKAPFELKTCGLKSLEIASPDLIDFEPTEEWDECFGFPIDTVQLPQNQLSIYDVAGLIVAIFFGLMGALCVLLLASQTSALGQLVLLAFDVGMRAMFILVAESLFFAEIPCIKWYKILRDPNSEQQIRQPKENSELIQVLVSKNHWIIIDEKTLKVSNFDRRVYLDHPKFKPGWKVISVGNKTISDVKEFYTSLNLEREKKKTKDVRFTLEKPTILGDGFTSEYRFSTVKVSFVIDYRMIVTKVIKGSEAERHGVLEGWKVVQISDKKVDNLMTTKKIMENIMRMKLEFRVRFYKRSSVYQMKSARLSAIERKIAEQGKRKNVRAGNASSPIVKSSPTSFGGRSTHFFSRHTFSLRQDGKHGESKQKLLISNHSSDSIDKLDGDEKGEKEDDEDIITKKQEEEEPPLSPMSLKIQSSKFTINKKNLLLPKSSPKKVSKFKALGNDQTKSFLHHRKGGKPIVICHKEDPHLEVPSRLYAKRVGSKQASPTQVSIFDKIST